MLLRGHSSREVNKLPQTSSRVDDKVHDIACMPDFVRKEYVGAPEVGIAVKVISIFDIHMAQNRFSADFNVNVVWRGKKDDLPKIQLYNLRPGEQYQDPEGDAAIRDAVKGSTDVKAAGFDWFYKVRFVASFRQSYELQKFPFDTQALHIQVRVKSKCRLIQIPWDLDSSSIVCDARCLMMDDYKFVESKVKHQYLPSVKFKKLSTYDPEALIVLRLARKPGYWVYNFGVLTSVLASFGFLSYALPVEDISGRLSIGFTLNLTIVASKFLMADKMPPVPYPTLLETHVTVCIWLTSCLMFENSLPAFLGVERMEDIEDWLTPMAICCWILYHLCLLCGMKYLDYYQTLLEEDSVEHSRLSERTSRSCEDSCDDFE